MSAGLLIFLGVLGLEGFLIYDGLLALAAAVPEVGLVLLGIYIMIVWAVQDTWRFITGQRQKRWLRRARIDENGIPWLE